MYWKHDEQTGAYRTIHQGHSAALWPPTPNQRWWTVVVLQREHPIRNPRASKAYGALRIATIIVRTQVAGVDYGGRSAWASPQEHDSPHRKLG